MGTLDSKLVALNAKTGAVVLVNRHRRPGQKATRETMAPVVVDGKVLIGTNGGEYGIRGFVKPLTPRAASCCGRSTRSEKGHEGVWATHDDLDRRHETRHRQRRPICRRMAAASIRCWAAACG
jgi:hypothetical protein